MITNQTSRTFQIGLGAVLVIPYLFSTMESDNLIVKKRLISTGAETVLAENGGSDGFTATYGPDGGQVTTSDIISTDYIVYVERDTPTNQNLDLEYSPWNIDSVDHALDKLTKISAENYNKLKTDALTIRSTDAADLTVELPSSVSRAGKLLAFDSSSNVTVADDMPVGSVSYSGFGTSVLEADDAGAIRTLLSLDAVVDVRDFGVVGDGSDESVGIQAALDSITEGTVMFRVPPASYTFATTLDKPSNVSMIGASRRGTLLTYTGVGKAISCSYANDTIDASVIANLTIYCTSTATDGIYCKGAESMIIRNVYIDNFTNAGINGIHLDGACDSMQIRDCRVFSKVTGILLEDQVTYGANNSVIIRATLATGVLEHVKVQYNSHAVCVGLKLDTMHFEPDVWTARAVIELEEAQATVIHNCYFDPHGATTAPNIRLKEGTSGTIITANRLKQNGVHSSIQCAGTSDFTNISHNIITGESGTIVAFESGTNNVFADNSLPAAWFKDSFGRPKTITVSAGADYTLRHKGWVDREWNISQDFSRFYDDFNLFDSSTLDTRWDIDDGDTVAVQSDDIHGVMYLATTNVSGKTCIARSPQRIISSDKSILIIRAKTKKTTINVQMGIWYDATNYMYFELDTDVDTNWHLVSSMAGSETDKDSGTGADLSQHIYTIEMLRSIAQFYIDGVFVGDITTDVLHGAAQIHIYNKTLTNAIKPLWIDTVTALQVR